MDNKESQKKFNILFGIDDKYVAIIVAVLFVIMMIPIVYLGKYNFMKADDFSYGDEARMAFAETGSFFAAFKGALTSVSSSYKQWQGTFSSIFLMSFCPYIFNYRFYKLVPALMVSMMTLASFLLSYTLINRVLKQDRKSLSVIVGSLLSLLMIERLYTVPGAIYWYNAAVHYIFAECCFIILICVCIFICQTKKIGAKIPLIILSVILAIEVGGSNYSTIVTALVTLISLFAILLFVKKKEALYLLPMLIVNIVSFIINVTAPGNSVRGGYYEGYSAIMSILLSFRSVLTFSLEWFDVYTLVMLIVFIPIFKKCVSKTNFNFRFPYLVLAYSVCIVATGFTSSYYALGDSGLSRTINVIKITWQILLLFNEAYLIGWIDKNVVKDKKDAKEIKEKRIPIIVLAIGLAIVILQPALLKGLGTIPTYTAFEYLIYGHAQAYWVESMERLEILEDESITDAVLKEHTSKPFYLYVSDITDNPDFWENKAVASYYGKNSVVLLPAEE